MLRVHRCAFTLVELLVVIGIIAVLMAIILPVVASSRRKAHQATCTSNMRQIVAAWNAYRSDHDAPPPSLFVLGESYVKSRALFLCPADPEEWGQAGALERGSDEESGLDPGVKTPWPVSYAYDRSIWRSDPAGAEAYLEAHPRAGLLGCPCHGERNDKPLPKPPSERGACYYTGLILRARPDGSVFRVHRVAPRQECGPFVDLYGGESEDPFGRPMH